jgi:hypothetical protein
MEFETQLLYAIDEALLGIMILIIMFGMGASLTIDDFKAVARRSRGVLIGFMSQFGAMHWLRLAWPSYWIWTRRLRLRLSLSGACRAEPRPTCLPTFPEVGGAQHLHDDGIHDHGAVYDADSAGPLYHRIYAAAE